MNKIFAEGAARRAAEAAGDAADAIAEGQISEATAILTEAVHHINRAKQRLEEDR